MTVARLTLPALRDLVEDTVLQALEDGVKLPGYFELRMPGKKFAEYSFEPARGYHVRVLIGDPPPTLH